MEIISSTALSVSVTRSEEFFLVSIVEGLAVVIMVPARRAREKRKSWISGRFGGVVEEDMVVYGVMVFGER